MSSESAAAAQCHLKAAFDDAGHPPPPEIRVDDEDGAVKLSPADAAADASWQSGERRRSMPVNHGRFVDEPYVFSLSQALAISGRRRSEPLTDANAETRESSASGGSPASSPRRRVLIDQLASSWQRSSADTSKTADVDRRGSVGVGATPKTSPTVTWPSLDELSRLQLVVSDSSAVSPDSDDDQTSTTAAAAAESSFLALPQTSDYLTVPARRHSVALVQPISSRLLDVIAEETVATDSKSLASSRRYSLSCHLNT